jgi:hypothetical protein
MLARPPLNGGRLQCGKSLAAMHFAAYRMPLD